ncbi:MAG: hypothetical protein GYA21_01470 [Myxococcales bacterium]|nr:hypothetical protein [Myxococcales bacterium]
MNRTCFLGTLVALLLLPKLVLAGPAESALDLSSPRSAVETQIDRARAGDLAGLKACFVERLRDRITEKNLKKAQEHLEKLSLDDLVAEIRQKKPGKAKIKMKDGRTFTNLVQKDGRWYAEKLWFKKLKPRSNNSK